ncbi:MAG: arginine--tRNA ligase [Candidatus Thermoplasmatota archaeon]|nr:arginine--tRNA ligase [Candidatus Thermoplasmatota archaeon]
MSYALLEFKNEIIDEILDIVEVPEEEIDIERPSEERGDYALPCYPFSPILKKDPEEIARELSEKIELENGSVERSGPYLNFNIDEDRLSKDTVITCLEKEEDFGSLHSKGEKVIVEHTSANPNGPLHVGRARNPIIGDTIARIYEKAGYEVERQYYINDIGKQMAILTWGVLNLDEEDLPDTERDKDDHDLVRYYQKASRLLEEDEELEDEIQEIIGAMEAGDEKIFTQLTENAETVMSGITESLERLEIPIDSYKRESSLIKESSVEDVIKELWELEDTKKEDGAIYYEDEDRKTFVTRENGTNLYPARDLAYHVWKSKRADRLINILGEDHKSHGRFLLDALEDLNVEPLPETVFHSFVTFEGEEMSTRKGSYVTLDEFMDTAHEHAEEEILKRRDDLSKTDIEDIAEKVGMGAVRYNIIKVQPEKPIDFVWEEALNFQGESAPFIQYSYTRAKSILEKWRKKEGEDLSKTEKLDLESFEEGEIRLLKKIAELPLILRKAADQNAPHHPARYAHGLAAEFNQFYRDYPVLHSKNQKLERIALVKSFKFAITSVLETLGIKKPKEM